MVSWRVGHLEGPMDLVVVFWKLLALQLVPPLKHLLQWVLEQGSRLDRPQVLRLSPAQPQTQRPTLPLQEQLATPLHRQMQHRACCQLVPTSLVHVSVLQRFFFLPWTTPHLGHTARLK